MPVFNEAANNLLLSPLMTGTLNLLNDSYTCLSKEEKHAGMRYRLDNSKSAAKLQRFKDRLLVLRKERAPARLVQNLQAQWEQEEKDAMLEQLRTATDFEAVLTKLRRQDQDRYDMQMGAHYEASGYYDNEQAA